MAKKENQDFFKRVYEIVRQIPTGKVCTYGEIAKALGMKSSARMVGWALNGVAGAYYDEEFKEKDENMIPAHRVVNRLGELSGKMHFATPTLMEELLKSEGVGFKDEAVDLAKYLWIPPTL